MRLTANHLEVIFHYYISPEPHPRKHVSVIQEIQQFYVKQEILEPDDTGRLFVTNRGKAWIDMLLSTPFPVQVWVDPREERCQE